MNSISPSFCLLLFAGLSLNVGELFAQTISPKDFANSLGMKMVWIAPGETDVKIHTRTYDWGESRTVTEDTKLQFSSGFWIAACETTRENFSSFVSVSKYIPDSIRQEKNPGFLRNGISGETCSPLQRENTWNYPGFPVTPQHPVTLVTIDDARKFCAWLSQREERTYQVPTANEWEFAYRSSLKLPNLEGIDFSKENWLDLSYRKQCPKKRGNSNYDWDDGFPFSSPVGKFLSTPNGLFDLGGNVIELTEHPQFIQDPATGKKISLSATVCNVGGSFLTGQDDDWNGLRSMGVLTSASAYRGFRVICVPKKE